MILLKLNKLKPETIIEIGKDLNILPKDATVTEDNVDMVVDKTLLTLPYHVVKRGNK